MNPGLGKHPVTLGSNNALFRQEMLDKRKAFLLLLQNMVRSDILATSLSVRDCGSNKKSTKKLARQSAPRIIEKFHISVKKQNDFITFSALDTDTDILNAIICGLSIN